MSLKQIESVLRNLTDILINILIRTNTGYLVGK